MAYVSGTGKALLFGGHEPSPTQLLGDTWEWDGEGWTQVADVGPSPRMLAKLVYDSTRNVAVLFGGSSASGWAIDTWEWDGENWTQIEDTGPDGQVAHETMTYDAAREVAVLDAGSVTSGGVGTWTWDGTVWTQLADTGPSKR
jgi:hypothetical protein